jgi:serine/threonine-protein kinase
MTLRPGSVFAGYRIERTLGSGGMGTVYLARHPRLPRSVALKVLDPAAAADSEFRARFQREAELAARLDHPNIVELYDRGSDEDRLWMSMRYVAGSDVARLLEQRSGALPASRAVEILAQAAEGLDAAHRRGLLHRDVKPANLLVTTGDDGRDHVFVTDFGIARSRDDTSGLTAAGALIATLGYVAPEQIRGEPLDHRCDVYALGATFHQMLTGAVPFARPTPAAVLRAHLAEPPPRPSATDPALPAALDSVIASAMAKRPADRYGSCRALATAAAAALASPSAPPRPQPVAPPRPVRMPPRVLLPTAAVLVVLLVLAGALLLRSGTVPGMAIPGSATAPATSAASATPSTATTAVASSAWGRDAELVALFPGLLPATPEGGRVPGRALRRHRRGQQRRRARARVPPRQRNPLVCVVFPARGPSARLDVRDRYRQRHHAPGHLAQTVRVRTGALESLPGRRHGTAHSRIRRSGAGVARHRRVLGSPHRPGPVRPVVASGAAVSRAGHRRLPPTVDKLAG